MKRFLVIFLLSLQAIAADIPWISGDGSFTNTTKWVGGVVPNGDDRTIFTNLGASTITMSVDLTNLASVIDGTSLITWSIPPGVLYRLTNDFTPSTVSVGTNQTSSLRITGTGQLEVTDIGGVNSGNFHFTAGETAPGNITVDGITWLMKKIVCGNSFGNSTMTFSNTYGRCVRVFQSLLVGRTSSNVSNCVVRIVDSRVNIADIVVGDPVLGNDNLGLIVDNSHVTNTTLSIANNRNVQGVVGTNAYVIIRGPNSVFTNAGSIGLGGVATSSGTAIRPSYNGRMVISNSALVVTPSIGIGVATPTTTTDPGAVSYNHSMIVDGATVRCSDGIVIGWATNALTSCTNNTFILTNSAAVTCSNLVIGRGSNVTLQSARVFGGTLNAPSVTSGEHGGLTNFMTVSSGTVNTTNMLFGVGTVNNQGCSLTVSGGSIVCTNNGAALAEIRNGYLTLSGGTSTFDTLVATNNQAGTTNVALSLGGTGTLNVRNSYIDTASNNTFVVSGTGRMNISGGTSIWNSSSWVAGGRFGVGASGAEMWIYGPSTVVSNLTAARAYGGAGSLLVVSNGAFFSVAEGIQVASGASYGRFIVTGSGSRFVSYNKQSYSGAGATAGADWFIEDGGSVISGNNVVAGYNNSSNCWITVRGTDSTLVATNGFTIGLRAKNCGMLVSNGALAIVRTANVGTVDTNLTSQNAFIVNGSTVTNTGLLTVGVGGWGNIIRTENNSLFIDSNEDVQIGPSSALTQGMGTNQLVVSSGSVFTNFGSIGISYSAGNLISIDNAVLQCADIDIGSQNNTATINNLGTLSVTNNISIDGVNGNAMRIKNSRVKAKNLIIK